MNPTKKKRRRIERRALRRELHPDGSPRTDRARLLTGTAKPHATAPSYRKRREQAERKMRRYVPEATVTVPALGGD